MPRPVDPSGAAVLAAAGSDDSLPVFGGVAYEMPLWFAASADSRSTFSRLPDPDFSFLAPPGWTQTRKLLERG